MKSKDKPDNELQTWAVANASEDEAESPDEMRPTLHELRIHQIELEMQNEELRRVQLELHSARESYFELYELAPISYCTVSEKGQIQQANLTAANLLGVLRGALVDQSLSRFILDEDQDIFYLHLKQVLKTESPQSCELRMVKNNGTQFWAYIQTTITLDIDGNGIQEIRSVLSDVSERKQAEMVLKQTEVFKQAILNSIAAEIVVLDHQGMILMVNEHWRRFALDNSSTPEQPTSGINIGANYLALGQAVYVGVAEDVTPDASFGIRAVLDGRLPSFNLEYPCHSPQQQRWFSMCVTPLGQLAPDGVVVTHTDITIRKQAEEATRVAQRQLEAMTAAVPGVVYQFILTATGEWKFLYLSKGIEVLYEVTAEEVLINYSVLTACIVQEDQAFHQAALAHLAQNRGMWEHEHRILTPSGKIKWVQGRATPQQQADGSMLWNGILTDITVQKQADLRLQDSERLFRSLLQDASVAILLADMTGNFEQINHAGTALLGYSQNEIGCMNVIQIHPAAELAKVNRHFEAIATNGKDLPLETKILCKNGRVVDVEIRPSLIEIDGRKLVQGIFIDLTERKRHENERLAQELKLRSVLVREVHHRIKNNLQGITGILRSFAEQHPETAVPINQAISQMQSISVIYGLQGRAVSSSVRACELTVAIAAGIESLWQKPVTVEIPEGWTPCIITEAEAVPLALVLNELISNAVKHGGTAEPIKIILSHEPNPISIKLTIHNTGLIPDGLGFEDTTGFGTGLQLVASLLPRVGARLSWEQQDGIVVTTLGLDQPVIQLEAST